MVRGRRRVGAALGNGVVQVAGFTADGYAGLGRFGRIVGLHSKGGQQATSHRYQYEYDPARNLVTDGGRYGEYAARGRPALVNEKGDAVIGPGSRLGAVGAPPSGAGGVENGVLGRRIGASRETNRGREPRNRLS